MYLSYKFLGIAHKHTGKIARFESIGAIVGAFDLTLEDLKDRIQSGTLNKLNMEEEYKALLAINRVDNQIL